MVSPSPPRTGSLFAGIRAALPTLIPSERRVAEVCLLRSEDVVEWSAAQLAAAADVSAATVVRACQSMGFRGFQQLRVAFAREAGVFARDAEAAGAGAATGAGAPGGGRRGLREPRAGDPPELIVDAVFQAAASVLADALAGLDRAQLATAVDLLVGARRLLLVGNGGSSPVAQDAALRFLAAGRPVEAPADALVQQLAANGLSAGDLCLLVTGSGVNDLTIRVAEIARGRGASVVAITSYAGGPLPALADALLVVGSPHWPLGSDTIGSRVPSLLLITALQQAVMLRGEDAAGTSLARQLEQQRDLLDSMIVSPDRADRADRAAPAP
ncbi:MurR/RpiR family transcriptional regulator [Pseudofrankia sp. EUN1h]|uniref:MurR/RpiR family transcriptional regulator n=2 Tax=Pseudofrankia TaxID=2994363 RepID=UPI0008D9E3F1|nr:MurR/RpiR family transcriptional regulator [Pseudofrankia sp. EUN1h]OHV32445.1 RpiR family transcriptional regulator [Pseudofrankia sp. EUN1h]